MAPKKTVGVCEDCGEVLLDFMPPGMSIFALGTDYERLGNNESSYSALFFYCKCGKKAYLKKEEPEMIRACGDTVCSICGKKYYDHPMDTEQLSYDGHPFLHIGCDGTRLKL